MDKIIENLISIKNSLCIGIGLVGGTMASALGGVESSAGFKGLVKKAFIFLIIV